MIAGHQEAALLRMTVIMTPPTHTHAMAINELMSSLINDGSKILDCQSLPAHQSQGLSFGIALAAKLVRKSIFNLNDLTVDTVLTTRQGSPQPHTVTMGCCCSEPQPTPLAPPNFPFCAVSPTSDWRQGLRFDWVPEEVVQAARNAIAQHWPVEGPAIQYGGYHFLALNGKSRQICFRCRMSEG